MPRPAVRILSAFAALGAVFDPCEARADFAESGDVRIYVYPNGTGSRVLRDAAQVLPTDLIDEIQVGEGGTVANQDVGSLDIAGEGDTQLPETGARELGVVEVPYGTLTINGSHVDAEPRLGVVGNVSFDPSVGELELTLSILRGVNAQRGNVSVSASTIGEISLRYGTATVANSFLDGGFDLNDTGDGATIAVFESTLERATRIDTKGDVEVDRSSFDTGGLRFTDGVMLLENTIWTMHGTGEVRVGDTGLVTAFHLLSSDVDSTTTLVGPGQNDLVLSAGSDWDDATSFTVTGDQSDVLVESGSDIEELGDLRIVGGGGMAVTGNGSTVDVGDVLGVGQAANGSCTAGSLAVANAATVIVRGTLVICPSGVLTLDPGGTVYAAAVEDQGGTIEENGGALIVPEAASAFATLSALAALGVRRSRSRRLT